jgi:hypothetical protein
MGHLRRALLHGLVFICCAQTRIAKASARAAGPNDRVSLSYTISLASGPNDRISHCHGHSITTTRTVQDRHLDCQSLSHSHSITISWETDEEYLYLAGLLYQLDQRSNVRAGLGACFYILMKLQPYLENRSFDPKYNSAYVTRFVIGMVAGVILAYIWAYLFPQQQAGSQFALPSFSSGIIGILGGFSAEAVEQILQRVVEVLLSLVRGDNSGQVGAKLNAQQSSKFADVRDKLDALDKAKGNDANFQKEMDALKALLKKGN